MNRTFTFSEGNIAYSIKGTGTVIVLLHGFLGSKELWKYYSDMLSKRFKVISIDLPGHGHSDCFGYVHSMEFMAESVKALLNHLKLRRVFLVGHSLGGYVSLAFAEKYPDHLRGLCLFHSTAKGDSASRKKDRDRAIKLVKKNHRLFINEAIPNLFYRKYKSYGREIRKLKNIALKNPVQGIINNLEGMKTRKEREIILKFAPYPVFFIIGKQDSLLNPNDLKEQCNLSKDASFLLLEDVGHMGFIEAKDPCWIAIQNFCKSVSV